MYSKCGDLQSAKQVSHLTLGINSTMSVDTMHIFEEFKPALQPGDTAVNTWTAIIRAHNVHGQGQQSLKLFHEMQESGVVPDEYMYTLMLSVIADLTNLQEGQQIHTQMKVMVQFKSCNIYSSQEIYGELINFPVTVVTSLISMYSKCGDLQSARQVSLC
jgi:pentatricopeptide repeat protein